MYAVKYVAYFGAPFVFFLIAASGPIIRVVFGTDYISGRLSPLLALISFSNIPLVIGQSVCLLRTLTESEKHGLLCTCHRRWSEALLLAPILGNVLRSLWSNICASRIKPRFRDCSVIPCKEISQRADRLIQSSFLALCASIVCAGITYASGFLNSSSSLIPNLIILVIQFALFFGLYLLLAPLFSVVKKEDIVRLSAATRGMGIISKLFRILLQIEDKLVR